MKQPFDYARATFFDNLAAQWDDMGAPAPAAIESFFTKLNIVSGEVVLDVGTGTGLLIPYLMKYNPGKVIALDLSEKMLQRVTAKYQNHYTAKLDILCGDVHSLNIGDHTIDVAICNGVYPHFQNKSKALAELYRVLKSGGRLAIHHFAGRDQINSIHSGMSHELIRHDYLESTGELAGLLTHLGFLVHMMIDDAQEFFLLAVKV